MWHGPHDDERWAFAWKKSRFFSLASRLGATLFQICLSFLFFFFLWCFGVTKKEILSGVVVAKRRKTMCGTATIWYHVFFLRVTVHHSAMKISSITKYNGLRILTYLLSFVDSLSLCHSLLLLLAIMYPCMIFYLCHNKRVMLHTYVSFMLSCSSM